MNTLFKLGIYVPNYFDHSSLEVNSLPPSVFLVIEVARLMISLVYKLLTVHVLQ